jgi:hypothetical protein
MVRKLSYEFVKQYVESFGYILLSKEYKNNSTPLEMICTKGHNCSISFGNFKNKDRRCSECYGNKKKTIEEIEIKLLEKGYTLLSTQYKNANSEIEVLCNKKHTWTTTWGKIQSGRECPYCSGKFNNIQTIREIIESEEGYKLISEECNQLRDYVEIECKNGHRYFSTVNNFKQEKRCPHCNESKGEKEIAKYLNDYNIKNIPQYKFEDCKFYNKLPFDFYLPQYNICIEYDGEFHYKMIMGYEEFVNGKIRDTIKNIYCQQNNIKLIRIPYWEFNNIKEILDKEIK